jgi:hypothetical protein
LDMKCYDWLCSHLTAGWGNEMTDIIRLDLRKKR